LLNLLDLTLLVCVFLVVYTYLMFPLCIRILSMLYRPKHCSVPVTGSYQPSVAIICAMYNEEDVVEDKIANFKELTYPDHRMYIGSDGSSDRTNEILAKYTDDKALSIVTFPRRGKVHVINDLIASATEDILVFTDANSMFSPDAIEKLVLHLNDPQVGAVCGRLKLIDSSGSSGEGYYWRYETMLKKAEGVFRCVIGGNGAIYAVRRDLVHQLPVDTINDDFTISLQVIAQGYGMTYAEGAIATEEVGKDDAVEFKRHIRDAAGHYRAMLHLTPLLNPFYPKRFFFYVSHRMIRWFVPQLMVLLLLLPWFRITDPVAMLVLLGQTLFYGLAAVGWLSNSKNKLFYIPFYFTYMNVALLVGFMKNILGMQKVAWDRTERA
jgi:biofilm PGA synthesis N-glycosyltransferase PgaC